MLLKILLPFARTFTYKQVGSAESAVVFLGGMKGEDLLKLWKPIGDVAFENCGCFTTDALAMVQ